MAKYYFHIRAGDEFVEDDEGIDLPDLAAVHEEAVNSAREVVADLVHRGERIRSMQFEIVDENGDLIAVFPFRSVVLD
ncbi:hypothetical protein HGP14_27060 [Rhizobium sp. P32RR-XVIII]|uniref:DUF6894 family protein n=1 Tax=Rhizobium sp. P32RR-XVIII TaxID=2726738 RepID=UPI001456FCE5|nr:hypothetical protein [Rhizobium sp. P32RR-XVIII]NLS06963.1 hypothetical protein [Rhizobium sp. P32RR-XVIII]